MTKERTIRNNIARLLKYRRFGGFIEGCVMEKVVWEVCKLYSCSPVFIKYALKYTDEDADLVNLVKGAVDEYRCADRSSEWFEKFSDGFALDGDGFVSDFDRWFIDTHMRLYAEACKKDDFLSMDCMVCLSPETLALLDKMTSVGREIVSKRYDGCVERERTPEEVAAMPEFSCDPEYVKAVFNEFDSYLEQLDEKGRKEALKIVLLTNEELEKEMFEEDTADEKAAGDTPKWMLSQEEIDQLISKLQL